MRSDLKEAYWQCLRGAALAALLGAVSTSASGQAKGGAQRKPPAKPPVTKPAAPPAQNPIVELSERVKKTLQDSLKEMGDVRAYIAAEIVGKGYGEWRMSPGGTIRTGDFTQHVSPDQANEDLYEREVKKALAQFDQTLEDWRKKKLSNPDVLNQLYVWAVEGCAYAYTIHRREIGGYVVGSWAMHAADLARQDAEDAGVAEQSSYTPPIPQAVQMAIFRKYLAAVNESHKPIWAEALARLRASHDRVDKARKRWGPELWKYFEFATAKTASPSDGHAAGARFVRNALVMYFTALKRPLQDSRRTPYPGEGVFELVGLSFLQMDIAPDSSVGVRAPWSKTATDPELQVFPEELGSIAVGLCLEPSVEGLRGYKEQAEPWSVSDVLVLPQVGPATQVLSRGRILPKKVEGSDSYTLYVYGKKVPTKASELKSLQSGDRSIIYKPVAFMEDINSRQSNPNILSQWHEGFMRICVGRNQVGIQNLEDMPAMLLEVRLTPAVVPGRKTFTMNGVKGGWYLDIGTAKAEISLVREMPKTPGDLYPRREGNPAFVGVGLDGAPVQHQTKPFAPTNSIYPGERIFGQIETVVKMDPDQVGVVFGRNNVWSTFDGNEGVMASRVKEDPKLYRTPPIEIVQDGDPRLDAHNPNSGREPGVLYLAGEPGDVIHVQLQDLREFLAAPPLVSATVIGNPTWLWASAMERAAKCAGKFGEINDWGTLASQTAETVEKTMITQVAFKVRLQYLSPLVRFIQWCYGFTDAELAKGDVVAKNRITIGNHAAMLLLRDHFVELMEQAITPLRELKTDDVKIALLDSMAPYMADPHFPPGQLETMGNVPYRGGQPIYRKLAEFYDPSRKETLDDFERHVPGFYKASKLDCFKQYLRAAEDALKKAKDLKDSDIQGLLELTGNHFSAVCRDLTPLLMKPVKDPVTNAVYWEPDNRARVEVDNIDTTWRAVQAQKEWSEIDTNVAIASVSVIPVFLPGQALRLGAFIALNAFNIGYSVASQIPDFVAKQDEVRFARGAAVVLGSERHTMSDLQQTTVWPILLNLAMSTFGIRADIFEVMGLASKAQTIRVAANAATKLEQGGIKALGALNTKEQAAFFQAAAAVELKEAAEGAKALAPAEKRIKDLMGRLREETKQVRQATQIVAEADLAAVAKPLGARSAADPVPCPGLLPEENTPFTAPNGVPFDLAQQLGEESTFFSVFKLKNVGRVVKFLKEGTAEGATQTMRGVTLASDICRKERIPHLRLIETHVNGEFGYYTQEFLPKNLKIGEESFIVKDWMKQFGKDQPEVPLTKDMQDALGELFGSMREKNIVFDDCKWDNAFIRRIKAGSKLADGTVVEAGNPLIGKLEAGIADLDRVAYWGDFNSSTDELTYWVSKMESDPSQFGVSSLRGNRTMDPEFRGGLGRINETRVLDIDTYWESTLERFKWLKFEGGGFRDGRLSLEVAKKYFRRLPQRGVVDLRSATPYIPPHPPARPPMLPLLMDWWRGLLHPMAMGPRGPTFACA